MVQIVIQLLVIVSGLFFGIIPVLGPAILAFGIESFNSTLRKQEPSSKILVLTAFNIAFGFIGLIISTILWHGKEWMFWQGGIFIVMYILVRFNRYRSVKEKSRGWERG